MTRPPTGPAPLELSHERKIRLVKSCVLCLAVLVVLTLVTALVFGVYHHVTDRPAKEMFGL